MKPRASVVIVSDYVGTENNGWEDIKGILAALARQDFEGNAEFLLCESSDRARSDLLWLLPELPAYIPRVLVAHNKNPSGKRIGISG